MCKPNPTRQTVFVQFTHHPSFPGPDVILFALSFLPLLLRFAAVLVVAIAEVPGRAERPRRLLLRRRRRVRVPRAARDVRGRLGQPPHQPLPHHPGHCCWSQTHICGHCCWSQAHITHAQVVTWSRGHEAADTSWQHGRGRADCSKSHYANEIWEREGRSFGRPRAV